MNILLIATDIKRSFQTYSISHCYPYIGLNYLASSLNKNGHKTIVIDPLYIQLASKNVHECVSEYINEFDIGIIGLSVTSQTRKYCLDIARHIKKEFPDIITIAGGRHIAALPEQILNNYNMLFDYLILGEAEESLPLFASTLEKRKLDGKIPGLAFKKGNCITINRPAKISQSLDKLPFPEYSQYAKLYEDETLPTVSMITTRGCQFDCEFCCTKQFWGKERFRSPKNVVDEMEYHYKTYKTRHFRFQDDTFLDPKERAIQIFQEIIKRNLQVDLYVHSRFDTIDEESILWFKRAGGNSIYFGLESGSEKIRNKIMGKNISNFQIKNAAKILKNNHVNFGMYAMFGYPTETIEDIYLTYELVKEIEPNDLQTSITKIFPGSRLFQIAKEKGIITEDAWLNEDQEYFTYLRGEPLQKAIGFQLMFDELFRGKERLRLPSEINPEALLAFKNKDDAKNLVNSASASLNAYINSKKVA